MREWSCEGCESGITSSEWPEEAICSRCERKRERLEEAQAVSFCAAIALARSRDAEERSWARTAQRVAERLGREAL